ncbi:hypothetical protein JCM19992_02310 [Thermostilla marina]
MNPPKLNGTKPGRNGNRRRPLDPFRAAVWRGLSAILPPLLTIVIFIWVGTTLNTYIFQPISHGMRDMIVWSIAEIVPPNSVPPEERGKEEIRLDGKPFRRLPSGRYIPLNVYVTVAEEEGHEMVPANAKACYQRYVELTYLRPSVVIPFLTALLILLVYLIGKFLTARIGRMMWTLVESTIIRLPLVSNVYGAVKQVIDFLLSEREMEYNRVVAVEYPRKGIWSLGMVTGVSFRDLEAAANEPVLSILIPTSPMPVTGFTINVPKSEVVDLDITVDQALQFIISCGVVVPPHQLPTGALGPPPPEIPTPEADDTGETKTASQAPSDETAAASDDDPPSTGDDAPSDAAND